MSELTPRHAFGHICNRCGHIGTYFTRDIKKLDTFTALVNPFASSNLYVECPSCGKRYYLEDVDVQADGKYVGGKYWYIPDGYEDDEDEDDEDDEYEDEEDEGVDIDELCSYLESQLKKSEKAFKAGMQRLQKDSDFDPSSTYFDSGAMSAYKDILSKLKNM